MYQIKMAIVVPSVGGDGAPQEFARPALVIPFEDLAIAPLPEEPGVYFLCRRLDDREHEGGLVCSRYHILQAATAGAGLGVRFRRFTDDMKTFRQLGGTHVFMAPVAEEGDFMDRLANTAALKPLMNTKSWHLGMPGMNCIICWRVKSDLYSLIPGDRYHAMESGELNPPAVKFINGVITGSL